MKTLLSILAVLAIGSQIIAQTPPPREASAAEVTAGTAGWPAVLTPRRLGSFSGSGGGGLVSNANNLTFTASTAYTNNTPYRLSIEIAIQLRNAAANGLSSGNIDVDTGPDGAFDYTRAFSIASSGTVTNATIMSHTIEPGYAWRATVSGGAAITASGGQLLYFSTNATSGGTSVTPAIVNAYNYTNGPAGDRSINVTPTNFIASGSRPVWLMLGDSIAAGGTGSGIYFSLRDHFLRETAYEGVEPGAFLQSGSGYFYSVTGSYDQRSIPDIWWSANAIWNFTNGTYATTAGQAIRINSLEYWYVNDATNGTTRLYTSPDNTTWTLVGTVAQTGTRGLAYTNFPVLLNSYYLRVSNSSVTTPSQWLWLGGINTNSTRPILVNATAPGKNQTDFLAMGSNNWQTVLTNINPSLVTWMWLKDYSQRTNWGVVVDTLQVRLPATDFRVISPHRLSPADETTAENLVQNMFEGDRTNVVAKYGSGKNWGFVDIYNAYPWTTISSNNFYASNGHYTTAGEYWEGDLIWEKLQIAKAVAKFNTFNGNWYSVSKTLPTSYTSSTTLTDDGDLVITNVPPGTWRMDAFLLFTSADNSCGFKYALSLSPTMLYANAYPMRANGSGGGSNPVTSPALYTIGAWTAGNNEIDSANSGVNTTFTCTPICVFKSTTTGTVKFRVAQFVSSATSLVLNAGSHMTLTRIK